MGDMPSSNAVWGAYLRNKGYKRQVVSVECPECYTLEDFCYEYPYGTYIIGTGTHCVCIQDGKVFDSWMSLDETPLYFYYKEGE